MADPEKKKSKMWIWIIGGLIVGILLIALIFWVYKLINKSVSKVEGFEKEFNDIRTSVKQHDMMLDNHESMLESHEQTLNELKKTNQLLTENLEEIKMRNQEMGGQITQNMDQKFAQLMDAFKSNQRRSENKAEIEEK